MAKEDFDKTDGVWRTVGGRRIFIRNGQNLADAMKESGKFNKKIKKVDDDEDYKLYKKAREDENSIDPMTENSTDWEALDKKYRNKYDREKKEYEKLKKKIEETETSTKDGNGKDSLSRYTDENGKLKPEREEVHRRIIEEYFEGKTPVGEGEEKLYYMTGGGSGTGKSTFVADTEKYFGKNVDKNMIKIDADDIKAQLYKYGKEMNGDKRRFSASDLHEESSALSKRINSIATDMNYHTMLDSTGDGTPEKLKGKIDEAHAKGYKVVACYGTCSYEKALNNNLNRYIEKARVNDPTARYVNEVDVVDLHRSVSNTLIADAKYFDKVDLYDMNDFKNKVKIASGGNGKNLTIEKKYEKEYNNFKNKGDLTDEDLAKMVKDYVKQANKEVKELGVKRIKREKR